eukprot:14945351-Alexandrium_andersonii.AAC.1
MFRTTSKVTGVRDGSGTLLTAPEEMDRELWESRASIRDTAPPLLAATQDILLSYFRGRACPVPARPRPTWRSATATVLSAGPSAPGPDGLPYEVYQ